VGLLQRRESIAAVYVGGERMSTERAPYPRNQTTDLGGIRWVDIYTRDRVQALGLQPG